MKKQITRGLLRAALGFFAISVIIWAVWLLIMIPTLSGYSAVAIFFATLVMLGCDAWIIYTLGKL